MCARERSWGRGGAQHWSVCGARESGRGIKRTGCERAREWSILKACSLLPQFAMSLKMSVLIFLSGLE